MFWRCAEVVAIASLYICLSAGLIDFNKYLMTPHRFPHSTHLTAMHMLVSSVLSMLLFAVAPQLYPTMDSSRENRSTLLKYMLPLGALFAVSLICANNAYLYSSVAFLQFCKEGNVVLAFAFSCVLGLQTYNLDKCAVLALILVGCTICASGEVDFAWMGLAFQLSSQLAEVTKNLIGEVVLTGAGLKLDPMTFVSWQAPCALMFLFCTMCILWENSHTDNATVYADFLKCWPMLLMNACLAFGLNLTIALTLKRLSTVSFILIGMTKDMAIVVSSWALFGTSITRQQAFGFLVTFIGILAWSRLKMQETAAAEAKNKKFEEEEDAPKETDPLIQKLEHVPECLLDKSSDESA
eukprot:CAMPEP_0197662254 /NCGR_PEP_ID=MMETSP1338-20131121/52663_1 /TAXON_ID=43686 ORGANISM="Pelagodinium beii, Strain RCC1491" /NCGR_SAMPLE_ID=MMETSP1338 /ASSEMBLY_ACC=CAM_ASM_000754 /LENGTH=352 /DNA_ID=CAMNT_0043240015 /DNA_START=113 /DNA_END=1171 /DNA_ORIENTATION=+